MSSRANSSSSISVGSDSNNNVNSSNIHKNLTKEQSPQQQQRHESSDSKSKKTSCEDNTTDSITGSQKKETTPSKEETRVVASSSSSTTTTTSTGTSTRTTSNHSDNSSAVIKLKDPPAYSKDPVLLKKLREQPILPEQMPSYEYVQKFLKRKYDRKQQRKLARQMNKYIQERNTFLRMSEEINTLRKKVDLNGDATISKMESNDNEEQPKLNPEPETTTTSTVIDSSATTPNQTETTTKTTATVDTANTAHDDELVVSVDHLTDDGLGQEWTCVLSGVVQTDEDHESYPTMSSEHLQRLVGYRMTFDGSAAPQDAKRDRHETGEVGYILPPKDAKTHELTAENGRTDGILRRQANCNTYDPFSAAQPSLCYGWRPNIDDVETFGVGQGFGLEDCWDEWAETVDESDLDKFAIDVTIEAYTTDTVIEDFIEEQPWLQSFPFGDLFGLQEKVDVDGLQEKYPFGIVVVFHWDGGIPFEEECGVTKEFAYFVPSVFLADEDATFEKSLVTNMNSKPRAQKGGMMSFI